MVAHTIKFQFLSVVTSLWIHSLFEELIVLVSFSCYQGWSTTLYKDCYCFSFFQLLPSGRSRQRSFEVVLVSFSCYNPFSWPSRLRLGCFSFFQLLLLLLQIQLETLIVLVSFSCYLAKEITFSLGMSSFSFFQLLPMIRYPWQKWTEFQFLSVVTLNFLPLYCLLQSFSFFQLLHRVPITEVKQLLVLVSFSCY